MQIDCQLGYLVMLISNGICNYDGKYANLNKNIYQFLGPWPSAISGKNPNHRSSGFFFVKRARIRVLDFLNQDSRLRQGVEMNLFYLFRRLLDLWAKDFDISRKARIGTFWFTENSYRIYHIFYVLHLVIKFVIWFKWYKGWNINKLPLMTNFWSNRVKTNHQSFSY